MKNDEDEIKEEEIKNEILGFLPSRRGTILTKRLSRFPPDLDEPRLSISKRKLSVISAKPVKPSLLSIREQDSALPPDLKYAEIVDEIECLPPTEEELLSKFSHIRDLPVSMQEKRKKRQSVLDNLKYYDRDKAKRILKWRQKVWRTILEFLEDVTAKLNLWDGSFKKIEGRLGAGVLAYFLFLRRIFYMNLVIFVLIFTFVVFPQFAFYEKPNKIPGLRRLKVTFYIRDNIEGNIFENKQVSEEIFMEKQMIEATENEIYLDEYNNTEISPKKILDAFTYTSARRNNISFICSKIYADFLKNRTHVNFLQKVQHFVQGTGWMEHTVMFIGNYRRSNVHLFETHYFIPLAFLCVLIVLFVICLGIMVTYFSRSIHQTLVSRTSTKYHAFSKIVFCGWHYNLRDSEISESKHMSLVLEMKITIAEIERQAQIRKRSKAVKMKIYLKRALINSFILLFSAGCYALIYLATRHQMESLKHHHELERGGLWSLFIQFLPPIAIVSSNFVLPTVCSILEGFEEYDGDTAVNVTLLRIIFLPFSSVFISLLSIYKLITCEPKDMCAAGLEDCNSPMCWETYVGQQMYKLNIMDFFVMLSVVFGHEMTRSFIVAKYDNKFTQLIGQPVFDVPTQVLALVYSQLINWLGVFYAPLLPLVAVIKVFILFYLKRLSALRFTVAARIPYQPTYCNAIFIFVLMITFIVTTTVIGYSITNIEPSLACGPFRLYKIMMDVIPDTIQYWSKAVTNVLSLFFSGIFFIPAVLLLSLCAYYYSTVAVTHIKLSNSLKAQILLEGYDKKYLLDRIAHLAKDAY